MTLDQQAVVALHQEFGAMTLAECERMAFRQMLNDGKVRGLGIPPEARLLAAHAQLVHDGALRSDEGLYRLT